MSCSDTTLGARGYRIPTIWANSADDKKEKKFVLLPRKQDLTFHAMETVCMKCKSFFLGRMRKIFQNDVSQKLYPEC